jgi:hypothetical protein
MSMKDIAKGIEAKTCDTTDAAMEWSFAFGEARTEVSRIFQVTRGSAFPDVIWNGFYPIVSNRVIRILQSSGITGWRAYPCELVGSQLPVESYSILGVSGRCASVMVGEAGTSYSIECVNQRNVTCIYGLLDVDLEGWDGSDMFIGRNKRTAFRCVTRAVRSLFAENRITGVRFDSIDEYEVFLRVKS